MNKSASSIARARIPVIKTVFLVALLQANNLFAEELSKGAEGRNDQSHHGALIKPDVVPIVVDESLIDSENFELGGYVGVMNVEDFETAFIKGIKLGYHLSESFMFEVNVAQGEAGKTSFEKLGNVQLLSDDERDYSYYNFGFNFKLPGESYFGRNLAFNNNLYISLAMGTTDFAGDKRLTGMIGMGYQLLINDWLAAQVAVKEHVYKIDVIGPEKLSVNTELTTGISVFF